MLYKKNYKLLLLNFVLFTYQTTTYGETKDLYVCFGSYNICFDLSKENNENNLDQKFTSEPYENGKITIDVESYVYKVLLDQISKSDPQPTCSTFTPRDAFLHIVVKDLGQWYSLSLSVTDKLIYLSKVRLLKNNVFSWDKNKIGKIDVKICSEPIKFSDSLTDLINKRNIFLDAVMKIYRKKMTYSYNYYLYAIFLVVITTLLVNLLRTKSKLSKILEDKLHMKNRKTNK